MKAILSVVLLAILAAALVLPLGENSVFAQAPTGPQGGAPPPAQQQQNPDSPKASNPAQQAPQAGVTIAVDVPIVTLDVVATTQHGDIIPGLKKENFRILDDGVPQTITNFSPTEAPITMVLLLEFSSRGYGGYFAYLGKYWSTALFGALQQKDWIALETFDMKTRIEVDFTQNKDEVLEGLYHLYFPGFSESNVFDALLETVDRLKDVKGKKSIVLLASGVDTFSKHTLDQFAGEMPDVFRDVAAFLRHQYSLSYSPTTGAKDGKFHKVKVELVAPDGGPLSIVDQKGKKQKYQVYAREGYQAPKGGVGD